MAQAVIPRPLQIERFLARLSQRVRRLEINKNLPLSGAAAYHETYSLSPGATWTPNFSGASESLDQIGLALDGSGLTIPQGWLCWVTVALTLSMSDPPAGESLLWSVTTGDGVGLQRADVALNGAQTVAGVVAAFSGWNATDPLTVFAGEVSTAFGTEFTPTSMYVTVGGIQLPVADTSGITD